MSNARIDPAWRPAVLTAVDWPGQGEMVQAVLFDMDGLMIDSEPLAQFAWQQAVAHYGRRIDEMLFGQMLGLRQVECSQLVCQRLALPVAPDVLVGQRNASFMAMLPGRLQAMPGLFELLDWLKSQATRCALVTSGLPAYVATVLDTLALTTSFEVTVTGDDVAHGKPAPDAYVLAAERLGVPAAVCLVLEDAPNGVAAAKAAGMRCWAIPNAHTCELDLSAADRVLPSLKAVRAALGT